MSGWREIDDLRRKSADQWKVVRWYAAETRWRVRQARGALTGFSVRYANEARQTLRIYAQAWAETRKLIHRLEARERDAA
jgi:hypothetical protein